MREYVPWDDDQSVRKRGGTGEERRENGNYDTSFSTHTDASAALVIFHLALPLSPLLSPDPLPPCLSFASISSPPTRKIRGERNEGTKCVRLDSICGAEAKGKKERMEGGRNKIPPKL